MWFGYLNPDAERETVAIKFQILHNEQEVKAFKCEVNAHYLLKNNEYAVHMKGHTSFDEITGPNQRTYRIIILEYIEGGDLATNVQDKPHYGVELFIYIATMAVCSLYHLLTPHVMNYTQTVANSAPAKRIKYEPQYFIFGFELNHRTFSTIPHSLNLNWEILVCHAFYIRQK